MVGHVLGLCAWPSVLDGVPPPQLANTCTRAAIDRHRWSVAALLAMGHTAASAATPGNVASGIPAAIDTHRRDPAAIDTHRRDKSARLVLSTRHLAGT